MSIMSLIGNIVAWLRRFRMKLLSVQAAPAISLQAVPASSPLPTESDSDSDDGQWRLPIQLSNGREQREWIGEEEWTITIQGNSRVDRLRAPSGVSIFRVPKFLKDSKNRNGEGYVPKIVPLGPYHHRNAQLSDPMDNHKRRALCRMMRRFKINRQNDLTNMDFSSHSKDEIVKLEEEIRNSYEEKIDCETENLALMLSLDGCFILEILRTLGGYKFPVPEPSNYYEPIFEKNRIDFTGLEILNDILMLENQIPFIVLQKLLQLEFNSVDRAKQKLFKFLVISPRAKFYPFRYDMSRWSWPEQDEQVHLLGLLHNLIVSPPLDHGDGEPADQINPNGLDKAAMNDVRRIPRAVELRNAGIKFKCCAGGIKKIKFEQKSATIYLPPVNITDHTEVLFRNLIALEVCKASEINYVTCYLSLMDELIDSEEDVALLRRSDIVTNYLGRDAEVAELFNGLCKGVTMSLKDYFKQLKGQVTVHYRKQWTVWWAECVKEYFSSPWRSLALVGAIIGLLLTAVQTIFSVLSYK